MVDVYIDIDKSVKHRKRATNIKRRNWIIIQMTENMDGILTVFISRHFIPLHILVVNPPLQVHTLVLANRTKSMDESPGKSNKVCRAQSPAVSIYLFRTLFSKLHNAIVVSKKQLC